MRWSWNERQGMSLFWCQDCRFRHFPFCHTLQIFKEVGPLFFKEIGTNSRASKFQRVVRDYFRIVGIDGSRFSPRTSGPRPNTKAPWARTASIRRSPSSSYLMVHVSIVFSLSLSSFAFALAQLADLPLLWQDELWPFWSFWPFPSSNEMGSQLEMGSLRLSGSCLQSWVAAASRPLPVSKMSLESEICET